MGVVAPAHQRQALRRPQQTVDRGVAQGPAARRLQALLGGGAVEQIQHPPVGDHSDLLPQVLAGTMTELEGSLQTAMGQTDLALQAGKTAGQLRAELPRSSGLAKRATQHLLRQWENGEPPGAVPYPVQVWSFGPKLTLFALTGETVVDYSLRLKREHGFETTWVAGYNNDLLSYVPSRRVLGEGGYEGTEGMLEYGHRGPYMPDVEERIIRLANQLAARVKP